MRRLLFPGGICLYLSAPLLCSLALAGSAAGAQRHSFGSSPPTAPPPLPVHSPPLANGGPVGAISQGLGPLQIVQVNFTVPAPQSITRQLQSDEERTRSAALSAIGAPGQYLVHGHVPFPRSLRLDLVPLGNGDELDAILTVELEQHLVSAILRPDDGNWRRVATVSYATSFGDPSTNPGTFLRTARSVLQPERYRAIFRGATRTPSGDQLENEADLRVLNDHAAVIMSFTSAARTCAEPIHPAHGPSCEVVRRWLEVEPSDPRRLTLVTSTTHTGQRDTGEPRSANLLAGKPRNLSCQPFTFSEAQSRFEPTANAGACPAHGVPAQATATAP